MRKIAQFIPISTTMKLQSHQTTTMLLPTLLFSILASVRAMPSLPFDQTDISSIDHRISAAIKEFADPNSPLIHSSVHPDADLTTVSTSFNFVSKVNLEEKKSMCVNNTEKHIIFIAFERFLK